MQDREIAVHQERVARITGALAALDLFTAPDGEVNYKALYYALFNELTDAIEELRHSAQTGAGELLIRLQQNSEARFIE